MLTVDVAIVVVVVVAVVVVVVVFVKIDNVVWTPRRTHVKYAELRNLKGCTFTNQKM